MRAAALPDDLARGRRQEPPAQRRLLPAVGVVAAATQVRLFSEPTITQSCHAAPADPRQLAPTENLTEPAGESLLIILSN